MSVFSPLLDVLRCRLLSFQLLLRMPRSLVCFLLGSLQVSAFVRRVSWGKPFASDCRFASQNGAWMLKNDLLSKMIQNEQKFI